MSNILLLSLNAIGVVVLIATFTYVWKNKKSKEATYKNREYIRSAKLALTQEGFTARKYVCPIHEFEDISEELYLLTKQGYVIHDRYGEVVGRFDEEISISEITAMEKRRQFKIVKP